MHPFRIHHLLQALYGFFQQELPADIFLRRYFAQHRAVGSHDRRYIAERVYKAIRWMGLISYLSPNTTWEERLSLLENLDPKSLIEDSSVPLHHRLGFPEEYFNLLTQTLGEKKTKDFCQTSNQQAPTAIRVNTKKIDRETLLSRLKDRYPVSLGKHCPTAIIFAERINFLSLPEFKEGLFEVQDEASQLLSLEIKVQPGEHFLDFCAGSGGKSLAIAPQMQGKGQIYLHDIRKGALLEAKTRLRRAGIQNAQVLSPPLNKSLWNKMDWVLVDAPCSGSGTLRRNPDMKWKFSLESLNQILATQEEIFSKALPFVKPRGYIVYATCSVLSQENEDQVNKFISKHSLVQASPTFRSFPLPGEMDGFFSVVLQKS